MEELGFTWDRGQAMMNGHLMSHGIDAISVPATRRLEFNTGMVEFYRTKDATDMFGFPHVLPPRPPMISCTCCLMSIAVDAWPVYAGGDWR